MSLPSINSLHLIVSEIRPGQTFSRRPLIRIPWVKTTGRRGGHRIDLEMQEGDKKPNHQVRIVLKEYFNENLYDFSQYFVDILQKHKIESQAMVSYFHPTHSKALNPKINKITNSLDFD